jgi:hypothetical protein
MTVFKYESKARQDAYEAVFTVTVVEIKGKRVRVGIDAPAQVCILREELACWRDEALDVGLDGRLAENDLEGKPVLAPVDFVEGNRLTMTFSFLHRWSSWRHNCD